MMNIFLNEEKLDFNEKYDIKGSWVSRNADPAITGQSITCTHCGQKYIFRKKTSKNNKASIPSRIRKSILNRRWEKC